MAAGDQPASGIKEGNPRPACTKAPEKRWYLAYCICCASSVRILENLQVFVLSPLNTMACICMASLIEPVERWPIVSARRIRGTVRVQHLCTVHSGCA